MSTSFLKGVDMFQANQNGGRLPSIEPKYGATNQVSPNSPRKMAVYVCLFSLFLSSFLRNL